jgi:hypothetical protein
MIKIKLFSILLFLLSPLESLSKTLRNTITVNSTEIHLVEASNIVRSGEDRTQNKIDTTIELTNSLIDPTINLITDFTRLNYPEDLDHYRDPLDKTRGLWVTTKAFHISHDLLPYERKFELNLESEKYWFGMMSEAPSLIDILKHQIELFLWQDHLLKPIEDNDSFELRKNYYKDEFREKITNLLVKKIRFMKSYSSSNTHKLIPINGGKKIKILYNRLIYEFSTMAPDIELNDQNEQINTILKEYRKIHGYELLEEQITALENIRGLTFFNGLSINALTESYSVIHTKKAFKSRSIEMMEEWKNLKEICYKRIVLYSYQKERKQLFDEYIEEWVDKRIKVEDALNRYRDASIFSPMTDLKVKKELKKGISEITNKIICSRDKFFLIADIKNVYLKPTLEQVKSVLESKKIRLLSQIDAEFEQNKRVYYNLYENEIMRVV